MTAHSRLGIDITIDPLGDLAGPRSSVPKMGFLPTAFALAAGAIFAAGHGAKPEISGSGTRIVFKF